MEPTCGKSGGLSVGEFKIVALCLLDENHEGPHRCDLGELIVEWPNLEG